MNDSHISISKGGTLFTGSDAVGLFAAMSLRSAIGLHRKCGMIPTRGLTITKMFARASQITGKSYKRGQHEQAENDLKIWIETMKSALPIVEG